MAEQTSPGGPAPEALAQARRLRDEALTLERSATVAADNTARGQAGAARPPTAKELEALRQARFGDGAGSVRVDTDLATGAATVVYVDADGKEVGSEPFRPGGSPPAGPPAPASARGPEPSAGHVPALPREGPGPPPPPEAESESRGRRR